MLYSFTRRSENSKTGPIPVTSTERGSCPPSCPHKDDDCFAEAGWYTRMHWDKIPDRGINIDTLAARIAALPDGQLWRHDVAGDLPGKGEAIDAYELGRIVAANRGKRGFTYTHKHTARALRWIRHAVRWGFTINLSADDAGHADRLAETGLPVTVIVPRDTPARSATPAGRSRFALRNSRTAPAPTVDSASAPIAGSLSAFSRTAAAPPVPKRSPAV